MNADLQLSLRALARLLDYPTAELQAAVPELLAVFQREERLSQQRRRALLQWCHDIAAGELLDLQARYVELFDRGRSVSLLLFEHVHGESRDRGQAMVDLLAQYEAAGFALDARELPDYLPLFLEFLSTRDEAEIGNWLGDIRHILALLAVRLEGRDSDYALVPLSLLALIGAEGDVAQHREQVANEPPDYTPEALDAVWEEEAVRFSAESDADCAVQSAGGQRRAEQKQQVHPEVVTLEPAMARTANETSRR
ncbi:nitrate reductase molybdenum cofactor assembly chaperone [Parahaliea mediterranea]|uniref:nitrate reductase molybdenum cofactor assembly chaperone n=1 Tax=Parahaliea mediterranea TaxID=651086 RepID=UPI000E2EACBF|nr:nitrate reductase molybdenum cofactor assembly chaperone [Parahaliea mediterranea]